VARVIEILEQIAPGAHINQRFELFALAVVKSMLLTLEYGVGPGSSFAFGTYALVLRNITGDAHRAYAFGRLAVDTDIRLLGHGGASAMFVHYWFLHHWIHPIETNLEPTLESAATGLREGGDILYGGFSAAAYVIYLNASGAHLDQVVEQADVQLARIAGRVHVAVFQARQERQVAQALAGRTTGALSFTDQTYDEQRDLASILATPNYSQAAYHCRSKMQMHYLYRDYPGAMEWAERGLLLLPSIESQVGEWQFVFYYALTAAALAGQATGPEQQRLLDAARTQLEKFEQWSGRCASNFAHRRDLIAAEILRASGDANAQPALEAALAAAESRGWLHDIALAHELLAALHRAANPAAARHHALRAADAYDRWGAKAKAADACALASGPFIVAQL
jgi:hypothetical protein